MPTSPGRSDAVVSVSRVLIAGCTALPMVQTRKLSLPVATITTHDRALGTLVASAVTPSMETEDVASNDENVPPGIPHAQPTERRRNPQHSQSPMTSLKQLPALLVLERIPSPEPGGRCDGIGATTPRPTRGPPFRRMRC